MSQRIEDKVATIAKLGTLSSAVALGDADIIGLDIPEIDNATLTFSSSLTLAGTYRTVKGLTLVPLATAAGTGEVYLGADVLSPLRGCRFIKITSSNPQNTAAVALTFKIKRFG